MIDSVIKMRCISRRGFGVDQGLTAPLKAHKGRGKGQQAKQKPVTLVVTGFSLAQWEGFEPSSRFSGYTISNRARYDHFDTTASHKY